jgi:hypothetical protein
VSEHAAELPDDVASLRRLLRETSAERDLAYEALKIKTLEVETLKMQLARLRRMQFGRSSEKLAGQIAQLELAIEELEASEATVAAPAAADEPEASAASRLPEDKRKPARRALPDHLPRETVRHAPAAACPQCGGAVRVLGEDKSEVLEYVPGHFKVIEHVRPKVSCRCCEAIHQAPLMVSLSNHAGPADRARPARPGPARPCPGQQVLRSPAAVPPGRDLRPRRHRSRAVDPGRVGRARGLGAAPGGRGDRQPRAGGRQDPWRRHAGEGAGPGNRQDGDRPALGLCPRRPALARRRPAGGALLL